ncbi:hypothetical protein T492DRAFT_831547 [Pavlovales sp. CCMP2436]|nr:hypothetical protein T492DRAFT_831547 [Pavlovales sp. CCMP2436]
MHYQSVLLFLLALCGCAYLYVRAKSVLQRTLGYSQVDAEAAGAANPSAMLAPSARVAGVASARGGGRRSRGDSREREGGVAADGWGNNREGDHGESGWGDDSWGWDDEKGEGGDDGGDESDSWGSTVAPSRPVAALGKGGQAAMPEEGGDENEKLIDF